MRPSSRLARAASACVLATVAVVACGTEPRQVVHGEHNHARVAQELSSGQLEGASLGNKVLSLTFDDGPGTRTSALSTYLKNENIRATFFVNGQRLMPTKAPLPAGSYTPMGDPAYKTLLAQLVADGHLIANHTTTHRNATQLNATQLLAELQQTDDLIAPYVPPNRFLFRAPFGAWSAGAYNNLSATAMNKYVGPIEWEAGGFDNDYPNKAADWACFQGVLYQGAAKVQLVAGAPGYATSEQCGAAYVNEIDQFGKGIVLMHDPYPDGAIPGGGSTFDMVKYMVPILKGKGYTFVRLDQVPAVAALLPCDASCVTCSGPEPTQCTSCEGGKFLEAGTCKSCTACQPGAYESTACAANADAVCTACDAACTTCTGGGNAACTACKGGYWLGGTTCSPCTACAAGTFASAACTATTDTVCTACDAACTTCSGPTANDCGACSAGKYLANGACATCATCAAGTAQTAACSPTANTVCTACASGTWSAANATSCTACGTCDDADACTTDACDATKGCTHTPIAGCTPGTKDAGTSGTIPDAGTSSSSSSGSSSASGSSGSSGASSSSSSSGDPTAEPEPESGCTVARLPASSRPLSPLAFLAAAALLVSRRRRPTA